MIFKFLYRCNSKLPMHIFRHDSINHTRQTRTRNLTKAKLSCRMHHRAISRFYRNGISIPSVTAPALNSPPRQLATEQPRGRILTTSWGRLLRSSKGVSTLLVSASRITTSPISLFCTLCWKIFAQIRGFRKLWQVRTIREAQEYRTVGFSFCGVPRRNGRINYYVTPLGKSFNFVLCHLILIHEAEDGKLC